MYQIGLNQFSDMLLEEVKVKYFGYRRMIPLVNSLEEGEELHIDLKQAPPSIDWREKGAVTPVKNQGKCGSCWAFSTTGALEGANFIKSGNLESFSEQYLVDCSKNGNYGCEGGEMTNAFTFTQKNGIPLEKDYPYKAVDQRCKKNVKKAFKNSSWKKVTKNSSSHLRAALLTTPISIGIEADEILSYSGGIFDNKSCGNNLDHGVLLVGFGESQGHKYWLVKNSWSTNWGEGGYIRFLREDDKKVNVCGILDESEYPLA